MRLTKRGFVLVTVCTLGGLLDDIVRVKKRKSVEFALIVFKISEQLLGNLERRHLARHIRIVIVINSLVSELRRINFRCF